MRLPSALVPTFASDRSWHFDVPVEHLWSRVTATDEYARWWPWLADFDPGGGFRTGASWTCTVAPPLPYRIRFRLAIDEVQPARLVRARVTGDIRGEALLTIDAGEGDSVARLRSRLSPANPLLQGFGVTARPLISWGHDWVLDSGQRQFVERAFAPAPDP
ncbi:SRPBCC family protein [Dermatobacter hominis]|uniref:SRPBCC family protein n=1 Tax=Dermatobacter hominis TaxID=2884263 RepID=UPI001D11CA0F|nr:SRPBCC family protein [Dermatobacter hominis]UDY35174.1 hypothetical protein LH044_17765 [Dermatobacter hominis]